MTLLQIIAAIFLPPLGTFLARGLGPAFWVTVLLTIIAWIPGMIFALVVILKPDILPPALLRGRASA
ncbi:YqaE/Pmp3 family membrane protein [Sphingomonas naphthae]|uniref:YqaE/Pmp3 family membrane protein n=1 Tax=Sphingomonas naphthae TaxID=1813468 RepID=A0ABY7TK71_9SPHN|nr:YqaE/Pmp3 family membrane protein [Sphingomonas naphthae]WCT73350.1 YqaE/Pmp3 family membrane protein [Sphingomonas naphthae]